ncbi:MAG: hypothetical protein HRU12_22540, partial [Phaeodactylibacter sp.]|nr:hypothetical protein [Phaeodactylibacter sp.]
MRTLTVLFFLLCSLFPSYATELSVSGKVFFGEDQQPLPGYEVTLFFAASDEIQQTITDDEGAFLFEFDFDFDDISSLSGTVSVFDFCTGMELFEAIVLEEDFTVA